MSSRSGIQHRYSVLSPVPVTNEFDIDAHQFYRRGNFPATLTRMQAYESAAPRLLNKTLQALSLTAEECSRVTHVIVTSCTGLYAPGLDFDIIDQLGLDPGVERSMLAFMGCYAAVNALKAARHILRSEPDAVVLLVNLELCTLHMQETPDLEQVLSFLVFADGCAASLISAEPAGLALDSFQSYRIPNSSELITWRIGDQGFDMHLSGQVPGQINAALESNAEQIIGEEPPDLWAIHPGGKTVLDAVESALHLPGEALSASREVLCRFGNMSSATIMFVLERMMHTAHAGQTGCGMAFGPGLTAETFRFSIA